MHVAVEICLIPLAGEASLSPYIARVQELLRTAGLEPQLHAYGTNVEGEWDTVFTALQRCHEEIHAMGAPRIFTSLKVGTRTDRDQSLADKVASVTRLLECST